MNTTPPARQNQRRPFIGRFGGLVSLFLGLIILGFGVLAPKLQQLERVQWQRLDCTITSSKVVEEVRQEVWGNGTRDITWYVPTITYTYSAPEEARFIITSTAISDPSPAFRDPQAAQHLLDQYPMGETLTCYVDPVDSSQVYLDIAPANPARIPILISGILFTLIGILGISGRASRVNHATSSALAE